MTVIRWCHEGHQQLTCLRNFRLQSVARLSDACSLRKRWIAEAQVGLDAMSNAKALEFVVPLPTPTQVESYPQWDQWSQHPQLLTGCEADSKPLRVAVLLSGGVDSSLALHLLRAAGHKVTAYYLKIWFQEDFRNFWDACPWEEDLEYCQAVCSRAGVPLKVVPLSTEYWDRVVAHCIAEVRAGRTPNPDVLCNSRVKFGAFLEYLEKTEAENGSYDRVASGHYARLHRDPHTGEARLALTPDVIKDQTYFLAHLSQAQLDRTLFPLGALTKSEVRDLAAVAALPNQARRDSQGICFLGKVRFREFIKEHLGEWPGPIIEEETQVVIGYHKGFWFHTVGQRKGIHVNGGPWYVTTKDPKNNVVYVSRQYNEPHAAATQRRSVFACSYFSWTSTVRPDASQPLLCKVRHGPTLYECKLEMKYDDDEVTGRVTLDGVDQGLAAGQYAVFYQHGYCLGCAVIS